MSELYHFSVDDVLDGLLEIEAGRPVPQVPLAAFLDEQHQACGLAADLYLFLRRSPDGRGLADLGGPAVEWARQRTWLCFGPHAADYETAPYGQDPDAVAATLEALFAQISRLVPAAQRSAWLRLHYFSECYGQADLLRANGVDTLLLTDKPAVAYHLPEVRRLQLGAEDRVHHCGLTLQRSHLRLETLVAEGETESGIRRRLDGILDRRGLVVLFTHEVDLAHEEVRRAGTVALRHLRDRGVTPVQSEPLCRVPSTQ
ncbi:MAG: hypothetical protein U1E45_23090 [Geminicoccaceae bacterium]